MTTHGGNTRADSSERHRREDDENESEECSKVGKSGRSLAWMLFDQLAIRKYAHLPIEFHFLFVEGSIEGQLKDRQPDLIGKPQR